LTDWLGPEVQARSGVIFAGGRATRLGGRNKALLEVGGRTILTRILETLQPLVSERVLLANDEALRGVPGTAGVRIVFDPEPHAGVLPALAAGLAAASGEVCLSVACDMPFVSGDLFRRQLELLEDAAVDVVIPRTQAYLEPMHAVYRREPVLAAIQAALDRGERRMISFLPDVRVRELGEAEWQALDPAGRAFFNVNTPEELAEAQRLAAR
jgi:molybdopterin-guanine dinucleotide biosynthesis protein A